VVSRQIEGELIIVPIRHGVGDLNSLYTLNQVGLVLWDFMQEEHTRPGDDESRLAKNLRSPRRRHKRHSRVS